MYALVDEVKRAEEKDFDGLLNNSNIEFVLEKKLESNIVTDEQSNNVLIPESNIHIVEEAERSLNDTENNVKLEQEI